jgi:hypothetical protein
VRFVSFFNEKRRKTCKCNRLLGYACLYAALNKTVMTDLTITVTESRKLSIAENLWIRGLNRDLNAETAGAILKESRKKGEDTRRQACIYAVLQANVKTIQEVLQMAKRVTREELLEEAGLTAKREAQGEARGKKTGEKTGWKKAIGLLKKGYTVDRLEQMAPAEPAS